VPRLADGGCPADAANGLVADAARPLALQAPSHARPASSPKRSTATSPDRCGQHAAGMRTASSSRSYRCRSCSSRSSARAQERRFPHQRDQRDSRRAATIGQRRGQGDPTDRGVGVAGHQPSVSSASSSSAGRRPE